MKPVLVTLVLFAPIRALAQQPAQALAPGAGRDTTATLCSVCHSLDYIRMNSFLNAEGWHKEVAKMRQAFGAPIDDAAADEISRYLSEHYAAPPSG